MAGIEMAGSFPPASEAEWRRLVERALDGRPFESLIAETFEGLKIDPLYQPPAAEGVRALRQKPGAWMISQRMDHPDTATANAMARTDLEGGADALTLTVSGAFAARGFGVKIESGRDLDAALAGIDLDRFALRLDAGPRALDLAAHFATIARDRRLTSAALDVDFGYDPIGQIARSGRSPANPARGLRDTHALLRGAGFAGHFLLADGRPYHEAGAGEAHELGCLIATGAAYLRMLETDGVSLEEARADIAFLLAADADEYLSLAKFRALRRLWARVEDACGLTPFPIRLHAETAFRMMTRRDPWVNILRATMGVFAAGVGGADAVTVLPFTLALGLPDDFARRIARNTQSILIDESHLAKVADPAAGAGSFEALTHELCTRAWRLFQDIEAQGGMIAALNAGTPQRDIAAAAAARRETIAHRNLAITGTSAFPFLGEAPVTVLEPSTDGAGEEPSELGGLALPAHRDAEPFEKLRAASDALFHDTGERPNIFLANLGTAEGFSAASNFVTNFFAAAGIEALNKDGFATAEAAVASFRASGCKAACLCAPQKTSTQSLAAVSLRLYDAGAARVYLVEPSPTERGMAVIEINVNKSICAHRDALAILQDLVAVLVRPLEYNDRK
ncbi:MAG TPA: methylmalonyl-CoA mutase subunit beta [Methylocella sp.]|nr:methylmalonyl-CoA mutase subunit beta [Methylocella sp.]